MQANRIPTLAAMMAALALTATTGQAFLFDDGTFESGRPDFEDGSGWEAFGTPDTFAAVGYEDWANGAPGIPGALFPYADGSDGQFGLTFAAYRASAGGFYHDVPVEPSRQYDFHIQSHAGHEFYTQVTGPGGSGQVSIVFSWYDGDPTGGGALITAVTNDITGTISNGGKDTDFPIGPTHVPNWQDWDYTGLTPPPTAAYLRTLIQWTAPSSVTNGNETMRWDNAELTTSLDPVNEIVETSPVMQLTYNTQSSVTYAIEATADLDLGFGVTEFPEIFGDDTTQQVSFLPQTDIAAFRLKATEFASSDFVVRPYDESAPENWIGFMNWTDLDNSPADDGASAWGVDDLVSDISSATNGGNTVLTFSPNTIGDPNDYWYPGGGGPGVPGGKTMEANLYIEFNESALAGETVTFTGTVLANTLLPTSHTAVAFIKDFAPDYSSNVSVTTPLTPGPFSISLDTDAAAGRHIQYGFTMTGPNVWVTDVAPYGNVQIAIESVSSSLDDVDTGLALVDGPVVTWTSQIGVHYLIEYSDDGSTWFDTGTGVYVGTGGPITATDPAGLTPGRTYRVVTPPMVPRGPTS